MNIAIVGLGVIGGSFAKSIRKQFGSEHRILAIDVDAETIRLAKTEQMIDDGETFNQTILQQADLVIFALYPEVMKTFVKQHQHDFKQGAILADTTGIKEILMADIDDFMPKQTDFIFGHPMAGREKSGWHYSSADVFTGANYVITPTGQNSDVNLELFEQFIRQLGFKRVTRTTAAEHDKRIAYTSQLTHAIAVALMNSDQSQDTVRYIGDSFRDLTRIANMNAPLWAELFKDNKEYLLQMMENFEHEFDVLKEAVRNDDLIKMQQLFETSTERRVKLEQDDIKIKTDEQ